MVGICTMMCRFSMACIGGMACIGSMAGMAIVIEIGQMLSFPSWWALSP